MQTKTIEKYFFIGFLLIVTIFTLIIFRPFLGVIIVGASLAVVLHPVYSFFLKKVTKQVSWAAALLSLIVFLVLVCGPLVGIGALVVRQSQDAYFSFIDTGTTSPFLNKIGESVNHYLPRSFQVDSEEVANNFLALLSRNIAGIFTATVGTVVSFFLVVLSMFYFLKDGDHWRRSLIIVSPLADTDDEKILNKLALAINGVLKGYLFIALSQGILMGIGLAIFGVPHPALWGVLTAFASFIPTIGTGLIAIPAALYLINTGSIGAAVGFVIWAVVIVGLIDNLIRPLIVGHSTDVPALLVLFSVLGGISLMGPVGVLIGPLTVSLLYALVSIYRTSFHVTSEN